MSKLVCIDAGHSLVTSGKHTPPILQNLGTKKIGERIKEYEFNKRVALKLGELLQEQGINVCYTGFKDDYDTPLKTRANNCNLNMSDLLISCHFNAVGNGSKFQNTNQGLLVLKTQYCKSKTHELAKNVHDELMKEGIYKKTYGVCYDINVSGVNLAILKYTNCPSILVEYGFMDYWEECKKMLDQDFIFKCAKGTAKGVCKTLEVEYKDKTKYLRVIVDELNLHNEPNFNVSTICGVAKKGTVLTIVKEISRSGTNMYLTKSGTFVSASKKYVQVFEK